MRLSAAFLAVAAAGLTLSAAAAPAYAAHNVQHVTRSVSYGDLNLRAAAGRAELQDRIEAAARRVCSQTVGQSLAEVNHRRNCRLDALETAAQQAAEIAG